MTSIFDSEEFERRCDYCGAFLGTTLHRQNDRRQTICEKCKGGQRSEKASDYCVICGAWTEKHIFTTPDGEVIEPICDVCLEVLKEGFPENRE